VLQKIDFNRELITVAVSNMATGVAGCGFTGSYIFRWAMGVCVLRGEVHGCPVCVRVCEV
jgi:MFS superfamily sulfate permease-like transporter